MIPLIAAAAARIIPAIAGSAGRAAASGATRMGASEGFASRVGAFAEGRVGEGATKLMNNSLSAMGGHGGGNNESRVQNFNAGGGDSAPSGGQFDTYNPVS
jgi:hypothetical protein